MPGQAKIVSVTTEKATRLPNSRPSTVTTGIRMFLSRCTPTMRRCVEPLGAGELDVVLLQGLARAGPRQADHQRDLEQRQVERRQQRGAAAVEREEAGRDAEIGRGRRRARWTAASPA